ncbi:MAG: hypothetical protein methR_P1892 [Methyloprofundus sp.]|nr:MAG: hypothetical protein methR_P1892 [Methyloprofundus sp.]
MKTTFKKNILSVTISVGLVALFSQEAMARPSHGGRGVHRGQPDAGAILNRMDFDGNGEVTVEDFINRSLKHTDKHFSRIDQDADELISLEEFSSKRSARGHRGLDSDIDMDALKTCIEETTGLTLKEHLEPEEVFALIDMDVSGFISVDEFFSYKEIQATEKFTKLDADASGVISEAEITTHMAERKALHEARKSCIDEQDLMDE